jgi:hypothetical protein
MIGWDTDAERDLWRGICSPNRWFTPDKKSVGTHPRSLHHFIDLCWGTEFYFASHPEQSMWLYEPIHGPYLTWLQTHILKWKELARRRDIAAKQYYIAVVLPRDFGKSLTATKAAMLWNHLDEPDMSTLIASATAPLAVANIKAIKSIISEDSGQSWFIWLYGNWKKGAKSFADDAIVHGYRKERSLQEESFASTGVGAGMTGWHHRVHVWDDPIYINKLREGGNYMTGVHEAVNASFNALQKNGLLMFVLTRYLDDDVAGRHFRDEGVATWTGMPCPNTMQFDKVPFGKGEWHVFFWQTEDELTGEPTHPHLWTKQKIAEAKRRNAEDFACQQQNNPGTSNLSPLVESQLPDLFIDYKDFFFQMQTLGHIEAASVHIDTAFKKKETIGKGDDNAIGVWLHDARRNGILYLDTDLLRASNEWREEDFNDELIKVLLNLRRRNIRVKCLTDEVEPGGKAGSYKNRMLGIVRASGLRLTEDQFIQFNRTTDKRARIRTGTGNWAEGYVRILLHKDKAGQWIIPPVVRKLFNQILRIDVVTHEDIADAITDGFAQGIWRRPDVRTPDTDEGETPRYPGDEGLRAFNRPLTNEEVFRMIDEQKEINEHYGPMHGPDDGFLDEPIHPMGGN